MEIATKSKRGVKRRRHHWLVQNYAPVAIASINFGKCSDLRDRLCRPTRSLCDHLPVDLTVVQRLHSFAIAVRITIGFRLFARWMVESGSWKLYALDFGHRCCYSNCFRQSLLVLLGLALRLLCRSFRRGKLVRCSSYDSVKRASPTSLFIWKNFITVTGMKMITRWNLTMFNERARIMHENHWARVCFCFYTKNLCLFYSCNLKASLFIKDI